MSETLFTALNRSIFDDVNLDQIYEEIRDTYRSSPYPWVIGYSGGKDSTTVLQLAWYAISELPPEERTKPVYVLSSDTLVETPMIVSYIDTALRSITETAKREGVPFEAHKVVPRTTDTFWVNLIGRGYPAPYSNFRWCTDRMKIQPANRFIKECVARYGEVVLLMGVRRAESARRAQAMNGHERRGRHLSYHHDLRGAYVYTPIEDWLVDDVWQYLMQVPSPWGTDNRDLAALYQSAQSGECPLVIDKTTPSCGGGRFGCWTCTVVERDRAMDAAIDADERNEWMIPLADFRAELVETQDPTKKADIREHKRRNGRVEERDGHFIWGPYQPWYRKYLLRRILEVERRVQHDGPDPHMRLILDEELHEIRRLWRMEMQDWEDSVPKIYEEVTGKRLPGLVDEGDVFGPREKEVLTRLAAGGNVPPDLVLKLVDLERQMYGMQRRATIQNKIDGILSEDWRTRDEVLSTAVSLQSLPDADSVEVT